MCFLLSTAASKTLLILQDPGYATPMRVPGSLLMELNFWTISLSFPCRWPRWQPWLQASTHNSTKGSYVWVWKSQVFHHADALLESRDVNLLPERPPTSLCRQAKRLEWGSAQQAGPPQCSHSSAVLGEGKDAGVPLMLYKAGAGNSRRPGQVPTASLCAWDPPHSTGHTLAQAGQPKNLRGWATPVIHVFETDGGKKGKGREDVGVGRKQTPDTTF